MVTVFRVEAIDDRIAEAVRRLVPQLSAALPLPSREALARMAASPSAALFCAETGGEVAGMLSLAWYDVPSGRCAWIEDVVVDAAARGRGAGRALVEAALEHARCVGADRVSLTSSAARSAARALYLSCGFERCDTTLFRRRLGQ